MPKRKSGRLECESEKRPRAAVLTNFSLSPKYFNSSNKKSLLADMTCAKPFPFLQLDNFVDDEFGDLLTLENELKELEWQRKENDLYCLSQTCDLKALTPTSSPALHSFRRFLCSRVREWLSSLTEVALTEEVDATGSCYSLHDHLLPHSDLIGTRHFAFVFYLTPSEWLESDGGSLSLFNADALHLPTTVRRNLLPIRNSFVLFEVSRRSWHRVEEVVGEKDRLSINGWFHSSRALDPAPPIPPSLQMHPLTSKKAEISTFVSPRFLKESLLRQTSKFFSEGSQIQLQDFFKKDFHDAIRVQLRSASFAVRGPPNKRHLSEAVDKSLGPRSRATFSSLTSKRFASFMEKLVGLTLTECKVSLRVLRLERGSYSIAGDEDVQASIPLGSCLEVHFVIGHEKWKEESGGAIIYAAADEQDEILRIVPESRSVSVVLREPEVFSFFKYANSSSGEPFFLLTLTYYNVNTSQGDS